MQSAKITIWETKTARQFTETLAAITDVPMLQAFLRDVMTEKEIIEISARFEAAKMLRAGKKYAEIVETTKLSSRTVARISDWMQNGCGGYEAAFAIAETQHSHIPPARAV